MGRILTKTPVMTDPRSPARRRSARPRSAGELWGGDRMPPCHPARGPAGVRAVAAVAVGGHCARHGTEPRRRRRRPPSAKRRARHQARAGYFPKIDVAESWQRGNNPVFVFSSRLAQRQFTAADFALDALNHPDATDNFRTAVSVEQSLFDRATAANVRAASIGRDMAATGKRLVDHDLTAAVTEAFGRVLVAAATSVGSGRGRDRARRSRAGRQPARRRPGDRRGCPAARRLPRT